MDPFLPFIMATVNALVLKHHFKKDGTVNVKIRLTHNRVSRYMDTQQYVTRKQLDKNFVIKDAFVSKPINLLLEKLRDAIAKLDGRLDFFYCDDLLAYLQNEEKPIDFVAFARKVIDDLIKEDRKASANNFNIVLNSLIDYFKRDQILITEINSLMLRSYEKYLLGFRVMNRIHRDGKRFTIHHKGLSQSGLYNHMRDLRWLFNLAREAYNYEDLGLIRIPHYPFKSYKLQKPPETRKRNISLDKLIKIRDFDTTGKDPRVELAHDLFMLSFYMCGTNAIDFYYMDPNNMINGRIEYKRRKTKGKRKDEAFISIKVIDEARPLLEKYLGYLQSRFTTHAGFVTALSDGMRRLQKLAGVPSITYYWARHTFATLARNVCRMSKDDIALALNHVDGDTKTTDIYIEKDWSIIDEVQLAVVSLLRLDKVTEMKVFSPVNAEEAIVLDSVEWTNETSKEHSLMHTFSCITSYFKHVAKIETKDWIAPILRQSNYFFGQKICVDWVSFEKYLRYRLGGEFKDWEEFYFKSEMTTVKVFWLKNEFSESINLAVEVLNKSRYLKQGKLKVESEVISIDNGMLNWIEV